MRDSLHLGKKDNFFSVHICTYVFLSLTEWLQHSGYMYILYIVYNNNTYIFFCIYLFTPLLLALRGSCALIHFKIAASLIFTLFCCYLNLIKINKIIITLKVVETRQFQQERPGSRFPSDQVEPFWQAQKYNIPRL